MSVRSLGFAALFFVAAGVPIYAQDVAGQDGKADADKIARMVEQLGSESKVLRESAEKQLDELDKSALEALKNEAEQAKKDGNADLELKLRGAIERLEAPEKAPAEETEEEGMVLGGRLKLKVLPGGDGISRVETDENGSRTVTQTEGKTTRTLKQEQKGGKITAEVKDGKGNTESLEFKDEAELKEKRPELHKIWEDDEGLDLRLLIPKNSGGNGDDPDLDEETRKEMEEQAREFEKELKKMIEEMERQMREAEDQADGETPGEGEGNDGQDNGEEEEF